METFEGAGDDGGEKHESHFLGGDFLWELFPEPGFQDMVEREN